MVTILRGLLIAFGALFGGAYVKDYAKSRKQNKLGEENIFKAIGIGLGTDFFDTLGIGAFAPTIACLKVFKQNVDDRLIPGTLNVAHTIPVIIEALIFTTVIKVDPVTLLSLLGAAVLGSYIGAGIISKMDERKIQLVMGIALAITAVLMLLSHPSINLMPGGGEETGLTGIKLIAGIIGNFILGALMTAGIGLYAPCMAMVYFLGMSSKVAFPIMMGSCALLMPVASIKFIKEEAYSRKTAMGITIGGSIGVFIAAFLVGNMPMNLLKYLVILVIAYTSIQMLKSALKSKEEVNEKLSA
ncbi:sulfite exporter TauE/SafE family protein [Asaccharospora irregularis]|uniref:Probable membrane transporter protein n=1 Tax=Asaccharospora irregularis DSM 2635 TaxID=1121321 RepID=A0A1M5JHR0_9FIRM|nr:sulfite exporter TauE/SafE family protein [Asaccharospora irregularis]SHG40048.1 Uncharacterized membrane protein YfcA [Asaccharospora irregularis DSM 2635]